jgi:hypothetical protein
MKNWRKLVQLAFALFSFAPVASQATHIIGGDIQYKYVGDSSGVPNQYRIKLVIYREQSGAGMQPTETVQVASSSCGITQNVTVNLSVPEFSAAVYGAFDCIPQSSAVFTPMVRIYTGFVILSQQCPDYKMSWSLCCRPGGITGITGSGGVGFYFEAELNNTLGTNSSPEFLGSPIAYYCTGGYVSFDQGSSEINGDSLQFELVPARNNGPNNPVPYAAGYSFSQPINTSAIGPFTLDQKTGNISFMANTVETSVIAIRVNEYRFDSTFFYWVKVGSSNREIQVTIAGNCNPIVNAGVALDPTAPGWSLNSNGQPQSNATCGDTAINLRFVSPVVCQGIGIDDLRIYTNNGNIIPVKSLTNNCQNGLTSEILLTTLTPIIDGDYYILIGVNGITFDATPLVNKCGKSVTSDTLGVVTVTGCPQSPYIQCLNVVNCDSSISNSGPYKYYNSWSFTSNAPAFETRWSIANGWFASNSNSDSVIVYYNGIGGSNFGGNLVLETMSGLCSFWDTLTIGNYVNTPTISISDVTVSPNPSSNELEFKGIHKPSTFIFSNLHGQVVESIFVVDPVNKKFKIESYPQGLYRVQICTDSRVIVLSFIKI